MIGFVVGSLVLVGIVKAVRYRRWRRYGPQARWGRGGGAWGLMARLRLSPEQRASFKEAKGEVKDAMSQLKETLAELRGDVALALAAPAFEEELVGATTVKLDAAVDTLRRTLVSLVGRAHTTLDDDQRLELARLLTQGRGGPGQAAFL